jgi:hypothetical protein
MSTLFFGIDDLIGHFLGFVSDRDKVIVMPLVCKTFHRLVNEPGSWKHGSDGFILRRPTLARLRLLKAVRAPTLDDFEIVVMKRSLHIARDWLSCCPNIETITGSVDVIVDSKALAVLARRLVEIDDRSMPIASMIELREMSTPAMRRMHITRTRVGNVPDSVTDLTLDRGWHMGIPMVARTLLRLAVGDSTTTWDNVMSESPTWNLRELDMIPYSFDNPPTMSRARMVALCELCPHLITLRLSSMGPWSCDELNSLAKATPRLEVLSVDCNDATERKEVAVVVAAEAAWWPWWPCLHTLTAVGNNLAMLLTQLGSPNTLRHLDVAVDPVADTIHDDAHVVELLHTILHTEAMPTFLRIAAPISSNAYLDAMHDLLAVVGPTLSTLDAYARITDVGRYCPRLRVFKCDWMGRCITKSIGMDVLRGCPVVARGWNTSLHVL